MTIFSHQKLRLLKAFSMPEVILSVFILSVGLVSVVAVMSGSLRHSLTSRDEIIASGLAQEGIELVRNNRDNDFTVAGHNGFTHFGANRHCRVDWDDLVTADLTCYGSKNLDDYRLVYSGGLYSHTAGGSNKYYRYIYVRFRESAGADRATVRSFVFWGNSAATTDATLASFNNNGTTSSCDLEHACVFTETFLTAWK